MGGSSSSSSTKIPKWMESAGKEVYGRAKTFSEKPYQSYSGDRVAGFSDDTMSGFSQLRDYIANSQSAGPEAMGMIRAGAGAAAPKISDPGRIIDEGGALGKISDYMNPHVDATLAPTIRGLEKAAGKDRLRVGDMASGAGAYNDARHGILERGVNQDLMTGIGDATGRAYSDAYGSAMTARAGDRDAMMNTELANAGFQTDAINRQFQGAEGLMATEGAADSNFFSKLQALLSSGQAQQQQAQTELDVPYTEFEKKKQDEYDKIAALMSVLGGVPYTRTTQTSNNDGGAGALGAIGALLGAI